MSLIRLLGSVAVAAVGALAFAAPTPPAAVIDPPEITLRLNGHTLPSAESFELQRGEPVIAEVILQRTDQNPTTPLSLDSPNGGWASRVKIAVTDAAGQSHLWPFVVTGQPSPGPLSLQPDATTTLVLRLDPAVLNGMVAGDCTFTARLELADGRGWRGIAVSESATVKVVAPTANPTGAALGDRQLLRVRDALLANDLPRAEAAAEALLQADVKRPEGFVGLALVAEAKGDGPRAVQYIDLAIARAAGEPPLDLFPSATKSGPPGTKPNPPPPFTPNPVPLEYLDLRRRFEQLPTTEAQSPATGSPHV